MGFDNECILNIQSLKGEYFCPVCRLLIYPNEALQAQCSHLYCKPCLTYVVRTTQACPYDGYLVAEADSKPLLESNKALADTIGKVPVHCLFHRSGCSWQGPLADCTSHCSGCAFGNSLVVCNRCGVQIVHRQVQEHAQSCPGVQAQAQQTDNGQGTSTTAAGATSNQNQSAVPAGTTVSQAQVSQASLPPSAGQSSTQQVNPATQAQASQATMPNSEQWYQQQQQLYQQYYQQYPGYDPYQQQYQQYYPYQQQAAQQYQQPVQAYTSQVPASQAPQPHLQPQFQAQQQAPPQAPQQAQQPSQLPPAAQPLPHPAQATTNIQQQIQPAGQAQSMQNQATYSAPQSVPQTHSQVQPYPNPQTAPPAVPQQGMQMPQFQQTHPQTQPSHPHVQTQVTQPYPQPQAQPYSHPQAHPPAQAQTHLYPSSHAVTNPPYPSQPLNSTAHVQAHHAPARAVSGYQSYPQPHPHPQPQPQTSRPAQVGAPHALHMTGSHMQPTNPNQAQAPFPQQSAQMRPPPAPAMIPNQQQPTLAPSQVQHPTPVAQVNIYSQPQQSGYPVPQRPGLQPIQHVSSQPQGFPGQGPYMQQQPGMQAPVRTPAPAQLYQQNATQAPVQTGVAQGYPSRPMVSHGGGQQPYSQAPGLANAPQMQSTQFNRNQLSVNSKYPSLAGQGKELSTPASERLGDQSMEKGKQEQSNFKHGAGGLASVGTQSVEMKKLKIEDNVSYTVEKNSQYGADNKKGLSDSSNAETRGSKPFIAPDSKPDAESGTLNEGLKIKAETADVKDGRENERRGMQPSDNGSNANAPPTSASMLNPPQFTAHVPGSQQRPSGPSLHHSIPHSGAPQYLGHPPGQFRPQGPAQMRPALPFGMNDNSQMNFPKHPPGAARPDNPSGGMPGSLEPYGRGPGSIGPLQSQGKFPSFPAGHSGPPQGDLLGGPPFASRPSPGIRSGIVGGAPPDFPFESNVGKPQPSNRMEGPGFTDGRQLELHPRGSMERGQFGHEEHVKPFPTDRSSDRRDFEDLKKFPRPSHLNGGIPAKFNSRFPPPGSLDHSPVFGLDRNSRPFEKPPVTFDHDPMVGPASSRFLPHPVNSLHPDASDRPGPAGFRDASLGRMDHPDFPRRVPPFGQHGMDGLTSRSPVRDLRGVPARRFGGFPADPDGNESQSFPFGKGSHEGRLPSHLQRGELDGPVHDPILSGPHKHPRIGDPVGQDMLSGHPRRGEHFGPRVMHSGEAAGLGAFRGPLEMGEPPFHGRFPPPRPFGEAFDRDLPGYPRFGEPGFRSSYHLQRFARDGGPHRGEIEPFDNPRKRKPGSIMCRICNVDCETVEGLDVHSQTREHQKKAMDMVMSIKQQNSKKQKVSNDSSMLEEGRKPRTASFEARGKKH